MIRSSVVVDYKKLLWPAFPPDVYFFFFLYELYDESTAMICYL